MDRKKFIDLCQKVSVFPKSVCGIKKNIPTYLLVYFEDRKYYPIGYELSFNNNGKPIHSAIIHELFSNCVIRVDLEKIKEV